MRPLRGVALVVTLSGCVHPPGGDGTARGAAFTGDPARPAAARAAELVARMTLAEKVGQMMTDAPAIPRLGVPAYHWWNEALHGVARAGRATVFPQAIALAATFDEAVMRRVATAISDEARAKHHEALRRGERGIYQGLTFFSPNVNIFRDPRWGRGQETFGEDPLLTARMGVAFIQAMQGDDARYLKTAATAKHLAAHSGPEAERHAFDARVSAHDLADTYLPQFEACVREGRVASVMPAYNRLNGDPCAASPPLLQATLRQAWGFDGYVVSDCGAIGDIYRAHHAAGSAEQAAAVSVAAGTDLNCGDTYAALERAVRSRLLPEADIDRAATRLFTARFRLGMFDPPAQVPWAATPLSVVESPAHRALAHVAAQASLVLLENRGGALPLAPAVRRLAVVGPTADDVDVLLGNYNGTPTAPVTILQGLRARARVHGVDVLYARGAALSGGGRSSAQLREAVAAARRSDVVVAVLGLSPRHEGEEGDARDNPAGDRRDLGLPGAQERLLRALADTGKPIVLVLTGGSALAIPWAVDRMAAILCAWYPGQEGGTAVADVLFGDANPAGRLPITIYRSADDLPPFGDYGMRGRTYRYLERPPLYAFGHGLSFTTFHYANLVAPAEAPAGQGVTVSVEVENTGGRAGDEVVQLYVLPHDPPSYAPRRWLAAFARVDLAPRQRRTVTLTVPPRALALVDAQGRRRAQPGSFTLAVGGRQPDARGTHADPARGLTSPLAITGAPVDVP